MTREFNIGLPGPLLSGHTAVGSRLFTDGAERCVYEDGDGRQYVLGYEGEPIIGQWLEPADEPLVVQDREEPP
jgi:hypothetical protein